MFPPNLAEVSTKPFSPNLAELDCFKQARATISRHIGIAAEINAEFAAIRAERISQYRADLAAFDWHFESADNGDVWREGCRALTVLREMQADLDADGAIWRSVAPQGVFVPRPVVKAVQS